MLRSSLLTGLVGSAALVFGMLVGCAAAEDEGAVSGDEQDVVAGSSDRYSCITTDEDGCDDSVGIGKSLEDANECKEGVDYTIATRNENTRSPLVLAFHGGAVEFGTDAIATFLADELRWDYYTLRASPKSASCKEARWMHVTSNRFNEQEAVTLAKDHKRAVSIHGYSERNAERGWAKDKLYICVGGLDADARGRFIDSINSAIIEIDHQPVVAFDASDASDATGDICGGLQGKGRTNVVNLARQKGLQLELPGTVRARLAGTAETAQDPKLRERFKAAVEHAFD